MELKLKSGYTGRIPKKYLPTYYYDPNLNPNQVGGVDKRFHFIIDPLTNKRYELSSKIGLQLLNNYKEKLL